ncbi:thymidylate kinase-like [Ctenocephalides felis]|uniref:thymidylate kinase-like n=1 Tax=Ctenocephalides felis TaxID=7515 RepID=UPI000E6E29E9|nr:thymidylate kinase-like [Ctenocephalides felis]
MSSSRGALIVLEGCDRSGKTTQCKKLVEYLLSKNVPSKYINFPDRSTHIGKLINSYLSSKEDLDDHVIHLLFTANRWEANKNMLNLLNQGTTLIVDRYSYSGVAFSSAKGLNLEWCKSPEIGLPKPDLVLLLTMTEEAIARRSGYGNERYETPELQKKVMKNFQDLKHKDCAKWLEINADKSMEELQVELQEIVMNAIIEAKNTEVKKLWNDKETINGI